MCSSPSAKSSRVRELGDGPATFVRRDCGVDTIGLELRFARIFCHNESRWQGVGASVSRCGWPGPPAGSRGMQAQTKPKHRLFACAGKTRNAIRVGTGVERPSGGAGSIVPTEQSCRVQTLSVGLKPLGPRLYWGSQRPISVLYLSTAY